MNTSGIETNMDLVILQLLLLVILFIVIFFLFRFRRAMKLEREFSKYSIDSIKNEGISFVDKIYINLLINLKKFSKLLNKSIVLKKMSNKYQKYEDKKLDFKKMDYISLKIFIIIVLFIISIISNIILFKRYDISQLFYIFIVGYFSVDIVLFIKEKRRLKKIDEDMLKAIIIMNSAYKSGKTTMQAIGIVKDELTGPIGNEFKKMYVDITFGLSLDVVFDRFAKRVKSEDAKYISASLTILNKTGGNIVNVFSSIEKSFFNRRKLAQELKMQTASSSLMYKTLISMPILIFLIIYLLNPAYYIPLFTTKVGLFILSLIIIIFLLYIYFMKKSLRIKV